MGPSKITQENRGLAIVHAVCADMDAIWRPTTSFDLGIDGQVEFLEPDSTVSTGYIIAVQVKSGESYFRRSNSTHVKYYPSKRNRRYWQRLNLPVILILHNPSENLTIYARVKPQLEEDGPILLRRDSYFEISAREDLLELAHDDAAFPPVDDTLLDFQNAILPVGQGQISGIEFLLACTNRSATYFELRMCRIVEVVSMAGDTDDIMIGSEAYEFIHRCVVKCWGTRITDPFVGEFELMWYELSMVPDIVVSLTTYGQKVLGHLWSHLDRYFAVSAFPNLSGQGTQAVAEAISMAAQRESDRLDDSDNLGEVHR